MKRNTMWNLQIKTEDLVDTKSYETIDFPQSFLAFNPILFKNNGKYCCLLGPDIQKGIFGFGDSPNSAIFAWDLEFKKRLMRHTKNDQVVQFVYYKIGILKKHSHV
jgi:hypothetical protein